MDTMNNNNTNEQNTNKGKGFLKWAIILGIVIVLNLFFNYAISLVYKAPAYEDYFKPGQVVEPITNKTDCLNVGGQWTEGDPRYQNTPTDTKTPASLGYCNPDYTKQMQYDSVVKTYNRNIFIILVVLGVASLVGAIFFTNVLLSTAFSWGGVLSLIVASIRYWGDANKLFQVIILAMALGGLIWIAIKKFGKQM